MDPTQVSVLTADPDSHAEEVARIGRVAFPRTYDGVLPPESIRAVVEQTYSDDAVRSCMKACAEDDGSHFLVAEQGGRVVGYAHYDTFGGEPELHRIYVDPDAIGGGIGTLLLRELHTRLGPGTSYILMVIASNTKAIRFYRRHGFVDDHEVDGVAFYREHMGVHFPPEARSVPCLVLRYRK
jgi:ribosomal protein S18 acetylase RimI-like enzyme